MFLFGRELLRQEVMEEGTGRVIGRVSQVVWDPTSGRLMGLKVEEPAEPAEPPAERLVDLAQIRSIQPGNITVAQAGERASARQGRPSGLGKHLLTDEGADLGLVEDVIFDPRSRQVLGYQVLIGGSMRIVPAIQPVREDATRIVLPQAVATLAGPDLSVLAEVRDRAGDTSFPISEDYPEATP